MSTSMHNMHSKLISKHTSTLKCRIPSTFFRSLSLCRALTSSQRGSEALACSRKGIKLHLILKPLCFLSQSRVRLRWPRLGASVTWLRTKLHSCSKPLQFRVKEWVNPTCRPLSSLRASNIWHSVLFTKLTIERRGRSQTASALWRGVLMINYTTTAPLNDPVK